ncbi:glyoxalase superfamily protein [Pseudomonas farsensis]|uniref:Bleomycin resistance protein n=1 Tax=Pseudomonas farsensis TaxID=2745492 RepID=A0ABU8QMS0_9PSED
MTSIAQAKHMAKRLRAHYATHNLTISHSAALEQVADQLGYKDWNTAAAALDDTPAVTAVSFERCIAILRIFDEAKAREFYCDFLGFSIEFEHRFAPDLPLYLGIERAGLKVHLSEHHGDASPGTTLFVPTLNIHALRDELQAKRYGYGRPELVEQGWGQVLEVHDPFGNRIRFCEG